MLADAGVVCSPRLRVFDKQKLLLRAAPHLANTFAVSPEVLAAAGLAGPQVELQPIETNFTLDNLDRSDLSAEATPRV